MPPPTLNSEEPDISQRNYIDALRDVSRVPHCGVRRDSPLSMDDFIDTPGRNTDRHGKLVLRNSKALDEVLHENFARVNRSNFSDSQRSQPLLDQLRPT